MALSATITLSPSTARVDQEVMATVAITNGGASPVQVLQIKPRVYFTGNSIPLDGSSYSAGDVPLNGTIVSLIPAGQTASFNFFIAMHTPSVNYDGTQGSYSVTCEIQGSDVPLVVTPTPVTISVTQVPKEASTP